jgi:hypothetical protein
MSDEEDSSAESASTVSAHNPQKWSIVELIQGESGIGFALVASLSEAIGISNVLILLLGGFPPLLFFAASNNYWWGFWILNLVYIFLILSMMEYLFARSMYH